MDSRLRSFQRWEWLAALGLLAALAALAYGPFLPKLGFYRDDWYVLWAAHTHGTRSLVALFSIDRPMVGQLFAWTSSVFGDNALAWQVHALFLRWLGASLTLVLLRAVWPSRPIATTAAAGLMLLYPGFLQQPNAMTFSNQLTTYTAAILSMALTVLAVRARPKWLQFLLSGAALLTTLLYQLLYEYMVGLEAARLLFLWVMAANGGASPAAARARWVLRRWAPYAVVTLLQLAWRAVAFQSERVATDLGGIAQAYLGQPVRLVALQTLELIKDAIDILLVGWGLPYYELASIAELRPLLTATFLAAVAVSAALGYTVWVRRHCPPRQPGESDSAESQARQMAGVGGLLLVLGQIPLVFAFRDVRWGNGFDRYTLQATLAAGLVTVGLLWAFVHPGLRRWILAGLVALAVGTHYLNGLHWAKFWEAQRQLWWQLSWRAPQIEPGTVLLAQLPTDGFYEDYEAWGPANLIYYPDSAEILVAAEVLSEETAQKVRFGLHDFRGMRVIVGFPRNYNQTLVASRPTESSCVHFLDGQRPEIPVAADGLVRSLAPYSDVGRIDVSKTAAPSVPELFGPEPDHGWCYAYQRASLARQRGDWDEVLRLAQLVEDERLRPGDRSEWLPFLEGYVAAGQLDQAGQIAARIRYREEIRHGLCDRIAEAPAPGMSGQAHETVVRVLCGFE